ncbi:hypothetical protein Ndes2437B_g06116 [Nannochloris sp. 'desiccata']
MHYSPLKESSPLYLNRDQQITGTINTVPGCAYLNSERTSLQIPFYLPDGRRFTLLVTLPSRFPREPPSLFLNPPLQHPWIIDITTGEVHPPFLEDWPSPDLQLATVVQKIIDTFSRSLPPSIRPYSPSKSPSFSEAVSSTVNPMRIPFFGGDKNDDNGRKNDNIRPSSSHQAGQPSSSSALPPQQQMQQMGISTYSFPQLASMPTPEIEKAMTDQAAFDLLLTKIAAEPRPPVPVAGTGSGGTLSEVDALRRSNADLARANLSKESEIEEVRRQIAIVRSTEYEPAKAAFDEKFNRQEAAREQIAPEKLIHRLRVAAEEADTAAASLERDFRSGALPLDTFIEEYTALRIKYHSRDMKYQAALQNYPKCFSWWWLWHEQRGLTANAVKKEGGKFSVGTTK